MKKIAQRESRDIDWKEYSRAKRRIKRDPDFADRPEGHRQLDSILPKEYLVMEAKLAALFREYHEKRKARPLEEIDIDGLSAVGFQTYIATLVRSLGYDVGGNPLTHDQGGDLIARKNSKACVIQSKRSDAPVGNKAVQEAISARIYYGADEAWVITNSTFTASAIALAQKASIKLVDGAALRAKSFL
jgi:HJR/Mrr/RecB family endonuclease